MGSACKLDDIIFWGTSPLNSREEEVRARISPDEFAEKKFNHTGSAPRRNKFHDMKAHLYYKKKMVRLGYKWCRCEGSFISPR